MLIMNIFFLYSDQRLPDVGKRNEIEKKQLQVERNRSMKWVEMMKKSQNFFDPAAKHREKMINRIYKGKDFCIFPSSNSVLLRLY